MNMTTIAAVAIATILSVAPASVAFAHSVGILDSHGCHPDRRNGAYHCHRGDYAGLHFRSKRDMLDKKSQGYTGEEQRAEDESRKDRGWLSSLWPFGKSDDQEDAKTNDAAEVVDAPGVASPESIEQRLSVLKQLHDKQLISDEEFATTKRQILADL